MFEMSRQPLSSSEESGLDWLSWKIEGFNLEKIPKAFLQRDVPDLLYAEGEISVHDIQVEVSGVGKLALPVTTKCFQKLIAKSSKPAFAPGSDTPLDLNVRDGQETPAVDCKVEFTVIAKRILLDKIKDSFGFGDPGTMSIRSNRMLLYEPGLFYKMPQDYEKSENTVASIVMVLPSTHSGGNLIIWTKSKEHVFSTEYTRGNIVKYAAFYADCRHEMQEVKRGFMVALTFDLILHPENTSLNLEINHKLKDSIKTFFDEIPFAKERRKVVYLLNHSYTEDSLRWHFLKGVDRERSSELLAVGKEFNIVLYLVLVEIHVRWCTDGSIPDPVILGVMGYNVSLSHWINTDNEKETIPTCNVGYDEVCWTKHTESFKPYRSQCIAGYSDNGTLDRWYRRAGIVFWPESNAIPMKFILNYVNSINQLHALLNEPSYENDVKGIVLSAGKYLYEKHNIQKADFEALTKIAVYTKDPDVAFSILSHCPWGIIEHIAEELVELQDQFGVFWCLHLLNQLYLNERPTACHMFANINTIVNSFLQCGASKEIIESLLNFQMCGIECNRIYWGLRSQSTRQIRIYECIRPIFHMLLASSAARSFSYLNKIIELIISDPKIYPVYYLAKMFLKFRTIVPPNVIAHCESLNTYLQIAITCKMDRRDLGDPFKMLFQQLILVPAADDSMQSQIEVKKSAD